MELKTYFAQDAAGNLAPGATVTIFLQGTTTHATGLTKADGTALSNPFTADAAGRIQFRAPDGYYDMRVNVGAGSSQTVAIQCVDYAGAKADADRAEAAADLAEQQAEIFTGPDSRGLDSFYAGGGWTGSQAGSANLQGPLHTNAMRWRFDIKDSDSLDPIIWIEKETIAMKGDTSTGDSGWDGGAGYWTVKKKAGDAGLNVITGYARHNGGSGDMIGVQGRGSGQHTAAAVWGMWAYAEVGFGAASTGVQQAIALESNTCNRGPDKGWMVGTGTGSTRGVLSITADGTNRCTHAFYIGNHKASGGSPGTGGWWTGFLVGANSIAANTNSDTTYVGDGEAFRINGSGLQAHAYGGVRFYSGFMKYGISFKEASFSNNAAILMGSNQRINWGDHTGSSRWIGFAASINCLNLNAMGLSVNGNKVVGDRQAAIANATAGTEVATINAILSAMRNHGQIATS